MALEYESYHHQHMTDKFTWQGASHPLNALPVVWKFPTALAPPVSMDWI